MNETKTNLFPGYLGNASARDACRGCARCLRAYLALLSIHSQPQPLPQRPRGVRALNCPCLPH